VNGIKARAPTRGKPGGHSGKHVSTQNENKWRVKVEGTGNLGFFIKLIGLGAARLVGLEEWAWDLMPKFLTASDGKQIQKTQITEGTAGLMSYKSSINDEEKKLQIARDSG